MLPLFATRHNPLVDLHADERDPFAALMRTLYADAPEALREWLKGNGATVKDVAADAVISLRPRVQERTRATGGAMSLHDAIHWAHARAQELVAATVFEGEKMKDDSMGASMSTYPTLAAYTFEADPDAIPLATHAVAIEALRTHAGGKGTTGGQLIRSEWEAAYGAIRAAAEAAGETMPEPESRPTLRSPSASPKSGLPDGSHYSFDPRTGKITLHGSYSRTHKTALLPLVKQAESSGKIARGSWRRVAPESREDFSFTLLPSAATGLADVVEVVYPDLARVLRQHAEYWMRAAGEQGGAATTGGTQEAATVVGDAQGGSIPSEGIRWRFVEADKQVHVMGDFHAKTMQQAVGSPSVFMRGPEGYYFACPVSEPKLLKMIEEFAALGKTRTAEAFRSYLPTWLSVGRTTVDQSREGGEVGEEMSAWETRSTQTPTGKVRETVYLFLPYKASTGLLTTIKGAKRERFQRGWAVILSASKIPEAAQWLRDNDLPRTGEALSRAFGGVKGVIDEEAEHCAIMTSISMLDGPGKFLRGADKFEQVTDPKAKEAIEYVRNAVRQRVLDPDLKPYPYQVIGAAFAKLTGYRTMNMDAPGLGKTLQAMLTLIADPEMLLPAFVVAPKNVAGNWVKEIHRWMPTMRVQLVGSRVVLDPTAHIYVMGYETMRDRVKEWLPLGANAVAGLEKEIEEGIAAQEEARKAREKGNKNIPKAPSNEELADLRARIVEAQQIPERNRIKYLIVDEAHKLKDPTAGWSKAGRALTKVIPHVMFLSGTPLMNDILEMHALLSMLHPETWGTLAAFKKQYAAKIENIQTASGMTVEKVEGVKDSGGLRTRMGCEVLRREKEILSALLSPKTRQMVPVCVSEEDAATYRRAVQEYENYIRNRAAEITRAAVEREIATFLTDSGLDRETLILANMDRILSDEYGILKGHFDEAAIRRKKVPLDEVRERAEEEADEARDAALEKKGVTRDSIEKRVKALSEEAVERALKAEVLTQLGRLLELTGQFKVPAVVDMIRTIHAQKAPASVTDNKTVAPEGVVVFVKHGAVMDAYKKALRAAGISFGTIEGSGPASTPEARVKLVDDFQNGRIDVVLAGEGGREGLTLTRAKYLIMGQRYWTPAAEQQAEDRIHRIGQKRDATILIPHVAVAEDAKGVSVDDYMQRIIEKKRALVSEVLGGEKVEEETLGEDEAESEEAATAGVLSAMASIKALKGGELCVDPSLTGSAVNALRRHVAEGAAKTLRENPRAFSPRPVPTRSEVQTVLFDRRAWSKAAAVAWLRHHGYDAAKVDTTEHYHRFRQHDPHHYVPGSFRTISFSSSVKAVVGRRA